jgi:hypothetical protein
MGRRARYPRPRSISIVKFLFSGICFSQETDFHFCMMIDFEIATKRSAEHFATHVRAVMAGGRLTPPGSHPSPRPWK